MKKITSLLIIGEDVKTVLNISKNIFYDVLIEKL
jgi:hypothetical protein